MRFFVLALVLSLLSNDVFLVLGDVGTASPYGPPYLPTRCYGDRQDQFPTGNLFVAVGGGLWDNGAACGRLYRMRCLSGSNRPCKGGIVDVKVVDYCPTCSATISMSNDAFAAISRPSRRINVEFILI